MGVNGMGGWIASSVTLAARGALVLVALASATGCEEELWLEDRMIEHVDLAARSDGQQDAENEIGIFGCDLDCSDPITDEELAAVSNWCEWTNRELMDWAPTCEEDYSSELGCHGRLLTYSCMVAEYECVPEIPQTVRCF